MSLANGLEGYRECNVCSVSSKMESRQCFQCNGRLDLKDLLLLEIPVVQDIAHRDHIGLG